MYKIYTIKKIVILYNKNLVYVRFMGMGLTIKRTLKCLAYQILIVIYFHILIKNIYYIV